MFGRIMLLIEIANEVCSLATLIFGVVSMLRVHAFALMADVSGAICDFSGNLGRQMVDQKLFP